jgi:hypothetical protein
MATLTNNINAQNIVDRFADYVVATGNAGIIWGTGAKPFTEMEDAVFGGTTSGKSIVANGNSLGGSGAIITASTIYNALVTETNRYTNIRKLRARKYVTTTDAGATGTYSYDQTNVAHLSTNYLQNIGSPSVGFASTSLIQISTLENFFDTLRTSYNTARDSIITIQVDVCHTSCHASCHGSRSRR